MKWIYYNFYILCFIVSSATIHAQQIANLEGISYQAVAIDSDGTEVVGQDVTGQPLYKAELGVRFSITSGENGLIYYQETHSTETDENGLFSLTIGLGDLTDLSTYEILMDIPWINGDQWLRVELAMNNEGNYREVSNEKLMAMPYSFYADDIADDAITTYKILDSTILNQDFATGSVDTRVILDSTILNEDFATGSVDTRVILDLTILNEDFSTGSVDTRVILDSTLLNEDFSTASIDSRAILDGSIQNEDIADETIDLTEKVTGVLPVANGGTGVANLALEGVLIGNGQDPIKVLDPVDEGQIITHVDGLTELYQIQEGPLLTINYNDGDKTITFTAAEQTLGETGVGSVATGNINPGAQLIRNFPTPTATLGDVLLVGTDADLMGITLTGYVSADENIRFIFYNGTNAPVNIGTLNITVLNLGQ